MPATRWDFNSVVGFTLMCALFLMGFAAFFSPALYAFLNLLYGGIFWLFILCCVVGAFISGFR